MEFWPQWGPSVDAARLDSSRFETGARGAVRVPGLGWVAFTLTEVEPGRSWSWQVAGITATTHEVIALSPTTCEVRFGAPWWATPYLAVCRQALDRLEDMARAHSTSPSQTTSRTAPAS